MTVSAVARFSPKPPARVDSRNIKYGESGSLNMYILFSLSSDDVPPSRRRWAYFRYSKYFSRMVITWVIWLNMSTRCPAALSFGRMRSKSSNLPIQINTTINKSDKKKKKGKKRGKRVFCQGTGGSNEVIVHIPLVQKQVWVIADLAELHNRIVETSAEP
jgi:hypothetical protein